MYSVFRRDVRAGDGSAKAAARGGVEECGAYGLDGGVRAIGRGPA